MFSEKRREKKKMATQKLFDFQMQFQGVPGYFARKRRARLSEAAIKAGLKPVEVVNIFNNAASVQDHIDRRGRRSKYKYIPK